MLTLLTCEHLQAELTEVLDQLDGDEVQLKTFPGRCGRTLKASELPADLVEELSEVDRLILFAGNCAPADLPCKSSSACMRCECCIEYLIGEDQYDVAMRRGDHLLTPGMVTGWREMLRSERFNRETAREFYADSTPRLVLLDTGTDSRSEHYINEFSRYVDVPAVTETIGLDRLKEVVHRVVKESNDDGMAANTPSSESNHQPRAADYALVVDLTGQLAGSLDEESVIEGMLELFTALCAPASVHFLAKDGLHSGQLYSRPASASDDVILRQMQALKSPHAWTNEGDGFLLKVLKQGKIQGTLAVCGVALHENLDQYLNLALSAMPVLSLALTNARTFETLRKTESELRSSHEELEQRVQERTAELAESKEKYHSLFKEAGDAIFQIDGESGRFLDVNHQACKALGYSREELLQLTLPVIDPTMDAKGFAALATHLEGLPAQTLQTRHVRKDGTEFPVEIRVGIVRTGRGEIILALVRDISERYRAERELREAEQKYQDLYDNAPDMFVSVDAETAEIRECNQTLADKLGYPKHELISKPIFFVYHEDCLEDVERIFHRFVATGKVNNAELQLKRKDGTKIDVILNATAARDEHGRILHSRSSWRDISQLKEEERKRMKAEGQLRQAQKMETIGVLAGGIAHDFNNILTAILGYAELLGTLNELPPDAQNFVQEIENAGNRASALTRQLLAFSRKQVLSPQPLAPNDVLLRMKNLAERLIGENVQLIAELDPQTGNVYADPSQLEQVFLNLIVNARDALGQGGQLTLTSSNADLDENMSARYPNISPGPFVLITVSDNGCGMDKETCSRIFEPFFTTKKRGTGLGLATAYGIVNQSGGIIQVYSELGIGSTFRIYLPRVDAVPDELGQPAAEIHLTGNEKVLVLEDDARVRRLTGRLLSSAGYSVELAANDGEAIEIAARAGPFDLLVSDIVLPGLSGPDTAKKLLASSPAMKVLFMSGYAPMQRLQAGISIAGHNILMKPFTANELLSEVRTVLDNGDGA